MYVVHCRTTPGVTAVQSPSSMTLAATALCQIAGQELAKRTNTLRTTVGIEPAIINNDHGT